MVSRACLRRCPWCGGRRSFVRRWLGKHDRCRTCGIRWRREEGFELGPLALNTTFTFVAITVAMVVGLISRPLEAPVLPLVLACSAVAVVVPLFLYPFTYLLWLAFDLAVHPPGEEELAEAAAAVADGAARHAGQK
jgi:uncharacterized protein (DUF983 family)